ncbi:hematological/neurological-like protein [Gossypium australe]|uniref:Hematological/neurological-like protein n=1 Tax=Gossypium australe TaxID=47621 RepID=A0A5B6W2V5_9ROSI|nr:hematological/neurological-like protein [Gossypium australe]
MERSTPVRKPHTSTADLLTWTEGSQSASSNSAASSASAQRSSGRYNQPSDRISKVLFGGQVTDAEAQSLLNKSGTDVGIPWGFKITKLISWFLIACDVISRRKTPAKLILGLPVVWKPCSGYKMKEMTGSGIFAADGANGASETTAMNSTNKTGLRMYQQAMNGISQISFTADASVSPKKPTSIPEVAKQRELSGSLQRESDAKNKKQISNAKYKEISGHDIFAPPENKPRSLAAVTSESRGSKDMGDPAPRNVRTSVKVSNPAGGQTSILFTDEPVVKVTKKIHNQKFQELTGNGIFKGDVPPGSVEKPLSRAKLREMSGNDIFSDGKAESRDSLGGVRKPPGGESSIALV